MPFIGVQPSSALLTSADIQDGQITTAKLADTAVTTAKITDDAVTGSKIENSPTIANGLTLTDGDISLASGHGISFASTSDGTTMTSELLDDYEEGTFNIGLSFGGNANAMSISSRSGHYLKVGNRIFVNFMLYLSSKGDSTGTAQLTGLPFTTSSSTQFHANKYDDRIGNSGADDFQLYNGGNATVLSFFETDTDQSNNSALQQDSFSNTSYIIGTMQYFID